MIVGETLIARHAETSESPWTLDSSEVDVSVAQPNGTTVSPAPAVTVVPRSASLTQTSEAAITATLPGPYTLTWTIDAGSSVLRRSETYFATWTDVSSVVRRRLGETAVTLADADLDPELALVAREIEDRFQQIAVIGGYAALVDLDQDRFDQALGLLTAAKLRPGRVKLQATGEVLSEKQGDEARTFSNPQVGSRDAQSPEERWIDEAMRALAALTVIRADFANRASSFSPFAVTRPSHRRHVVTPERFALSSSDWWPLA